MHSPLRSRNSVPFLQSRSNKKLGNLLPTTNTFKTQVTSIRNSVPIINHSQSKGRENIKCPPPFGPGHRGSPSETVGSTPEPQVLLRYYPRSRPLHLRPRHCPRGSSATNHPSCSCSWLPHHHHWKLPYSDPLLEVREEHQWRRTHLHRRWDRKSPAHARIGRTDDGR